MEMTGAQVVVECLLEQGVDFDCVICDNDEMALGVIEALEAAGWDPGAAPIVSVDHTAEGAAALESGKLYTDAELRKLLSGHLCRCTGYENILRAVKKTMYRRLGLPMPAEALIESSKVRPYGRTFFGRIFV